MFAVVAHVLRDDVDIALELTGLVRSHRVSELTRDGAHGRYTLSLRGAVFARAGEGRTHGSSLDEWERCVREVWSFFRDNTAEGQ